MGKPRAKSVAEGRFG